MATLLQPPPPLQHPNPPPIALPAQPNDPNSTAAPPWFQGAIQQLRMDLWNDMQDMMRAEILPDLKCLMNHGRGEGVVVPFEVSWIIFPPLHSINAIENLDGHDLVEDLNGYGVVPPVGMNPRATNRFWKETLKGLIGASI
ncbi:hypothetical protein PAXRUDRAFT_36042 [Paxillus rubicundulus Ve08.2h10]|uniref:Mug135-like C-terminal domain-containing protein n=1 Tax=Paxillus rubicundulus Ve08.2h10 TaxID=930991 RepID=A0A0D0DAK9_9AGAM|nr:hypothetical protein PAXRUDRAFT_36042 [Paxillus rubicundulus Ve08.2h10]